MSASSGKVLLYIIGAGGLLGLTFGFFWAIDWLNGYLGAFNIVTYTESVWILSGVLAFLIVFSALAKDKARLEMLSSASFLIYVIVAYSYGCTIMSFFIPYNGFGSVNIGFLANLSSLIPMIGDIAANVVIVNTVAAVLSIVGQSIKFMKTFVKSMKKYEEPKERSSSK
ncbi:MAG: hypothetical protein ACTSUE_17050 [Promethearchaeota archaeon]